jgi:hypothetical protein
VPHLPPPSPAPSARRPLPARAAPASRRCPVSAAGLRRSVRRQQPPRHVASVGRCDPLGPLGGRQRPGWVHLGRVGGDEVVWNNICSSPLRRLIRSRSEGVRGDRRRETACSGVFRCQGAQSSAVTRALPLVCASLRCVRPRVGPGAS